MRQGLSGALSPAVRQLGAHPTPGKEHLFSVVVTPLLSVVVPVFNGGPEIAGNVETIRAAVAQPFGRDQIEMIVVSDGSIDGTLERIAGARDEGIRVIHYDRNLGKGYAVKVGILAAKGDWIGLCDADLDLDPASLSTFFLVAEREALDLAVGSKRHPESVVHYPRSRRIGSWGYQQLNRLLFGLSVRDTQVGLKVLSRGVADHVVPLLLVKRFAFDLELLAVAHALGYRRIKELPIRLDYRFTGSGVRSRAVLRALWDTAAVFYRLRLLRTYQRKRELLGHGRAALDVTPSVSLVGGDEDVAELQDYPVAEVVQDVTGATGDVVALLAPGGRPAGNWLSAAIPFLRDPTVAAVVCPALAPIEAPLREQVAAAVLESHLGGGSRRERYLPGNLRTVSDFPADSLVVRRSALDALGSVEPDELVTRLARRGSVVYTPETVVVVPPPPAVRPLLRRVRRDGERRGRAARISRGRSLSASTAVAFSPAALALVGLPLLLAGGPREQTAGGALLVVYVVAIAGSASLGALRFRSPRVGLLAAPTLVAGQIAYVSGFVRGLFT